MVPGLFDRRIAAAMSAFLLWNVAGTALSQQISAPLDSGFARTSSIAMTVDEMLGSRKARALTEPIWALAIRSFGSLKSSTSLSV